MKYNATDTSQLIFLKNRGLVAVISSKLLRVEQKDITFEYDSHVFGNNPIEDYGLVEILCNLLN